ncbi:MAG: hypothetical protein HC923_05540 [Myxococcales bacterium]|nr:hypothetical protein [Myxococcales bacterium]
MTGKYLSGERFVSTPRASERRPLDKKKALTIKGAAENNLKNVEVAIPLGGLVVVTGVSGSGKSTLVNDILLAAVRRHLGLRAKPGRHDRINGLKQIDRVIGGRSDAHWPHPSVEPCDVHEHVRRCPKAVRASPGRQNARVQGRAILVQREGRQV